MGAVSGLITGINKGVGGFIAPSAPNLQMPTTTGQATTAYDQTQAGLAQQQQFLNALQAQGGIQNQSNVFNQLQNVASGQGPNPAQAMLNQQTGANVANQAALMAGQRGAGANAGLLARQAAQQGAATQQQAVGQGATMQAQQSLGALNQLGGIAGQQVGQQAGALTGYNQFAQNQQANLLGSINAQNTAQLGASAQQNAINAANAASNKAIAGGIIGAGAGALGGAPMAAGGEVKKMAFGGETMESGGGSEDSNPNGPRSHIAKALSGFKPAFDTSSTASAGAGDIAPALDAYTTKSSSGGGGDMMKTAMKVAPMVMAKGGKVPALVSPGEVYLSPKEVKKVEQGKKSPLDGEKIPGQAKVKGDSLKNDTVPKTLEEGGIVLPRSVTEHPHAGWEAKKFIEAIRKKKGSLG